LALLLAFCQLWPIGELVSCVDEIVYRTSGIAQPLVRPNLNLAAGKSELARLFEIHRLIEGELDAGPQPDHRCLLDPEPHRDGVGGLEADAENVSVRRYGFLVVACAASTP
jgi:hypothetical protein